MTTKDAEQIKKAVKERYAEIARKQSETCCPPQAEASSSCCAPGATTAKVPKYADKLYAKEELETLPDSVSDAALGCGNPAAIAGLKEGEVVLDLGSGGGIDCFLAAQKVGSEGKIIGLDMTPDMIKLARENARKMGVSNVEFRLGEMEHMPVESSSVDVIISNCVINLSPDKDAVFREAFRVLKPGGRLSVSDIALTGELPEKVRASLENWAGCIAGSLEKDVYLGKVQAAGFEQVTIENITPVSFTAEDWAKNIVSLQVKALKPRQSVT